MALETRYIGHVSLVRDAEVVARTAFATDWEQLRHTFDVVVELGPDATNYEIATAYLHDVVEDTGLTLEDLTDIGFPKVIVVAVSYLTRGPGQPYGEYKEALLAAPGEEGRIARKVKLADARHNYKRCLGAPQIPKWFSLGEKRYKPMIEALEAVV